MVHHNSHGLHLRRNYQSLPYTCYPRYRAQYRFWNWCEECLEKSLFWICCEFATWSSVFCDFQEVSHRYVKKDNFSLFSKDHHRYLAGDGLDTDLPTEWEGNFFTNGPLKLLWLFLNPLFYAFRPMIVRPKTPTHYEFKVLWLSKLHVTFY